MVRKFTVCDAQIRRVDLELLLSSLKQHLSIAGNVGEIQEAVNQEDGMCDYVSVTLSSLRGQTISMPTMSVATTNQRHSFSPRVRTAAALNEHATRSRGGSPFHSVTVVPHLCDFGIASSIGLLPL